MAAFIVLVYGLAQAVAYVFPVVNCKPAALRLFAAIPFAVIAAAIGSWLGSENWRYQTAIATTARKDLVAGVCRQESFELTSRHVLAHDGDAIFLFLPAAHGKTFVVVADEGSDPRAIALSDSQGGLCGSHWRWLCAPESGIVSDLKIAGPQVALMDGLWLEGSEFWDRIDDFPTDGSLLDMPFEQVERLIREDADHNTAVVSAGTPPSYTLAR